MPWPSKFLSQRRRNLKLDSTITIFSPIICTPEKGVFLIFYRTKNTKFLCLVQKYTHQVCALTDGVLKCEQDLFQLFVLLQPCMFKDLISCHCETFGFSLNTQLSSCIKTYPITHLQLALKDWILHTFPSAKDCNQHHTKTSISLHIKKKNFPSI
jgi:hypothetical protein